MPRTKAIVPACKICGAPFTGLRGWINYAFRDIEPFTKNPNICNS